MLDKLDALIAALERGKAPRNSADFGLPPNVRPMVDALLKAGTVQTFGTNIKFVPKVCTVPAFLALRQLAQCGELVWPTGGPALQALVMLLSSGPELPRLLCRRPARAAALIDDPLRAFDRSSIADELAPRWSLAQTPAAFADTLASFRNDHVVRLAAAEFAAVPLERVGRELADLADVCLDAAIAYAMGAHAERYGLPMLDGADDGAPRRCGFGAVAMGKYGARELNFCSDIDVVFIYESDEGAAGTRSLHEFFSGVSRQVVKLLSEASVEGMVFRVDLGLRPEGRRGPVCNSLASAERYYETWGGCYDRLAWLKARAAAGDRAIPQALIDFLRPFVFPRALRESIIEQIHELSQRIRAELAVKRVSAGFNVKLDTGGIRDVEFFVQALQLLHAGKQPALRSPATLDALDQLLFAGLISEREQRTLAEAYDLFRRVEHRLQLYAGRQTHFLPDAGELRQQIAAHLGFGEQELGALLARLRGEVEAIYRTLGAPADDPQLAVLRDLDDPRAGEGLGALGFRQPTVALDQLRILRQKPWGPFGHVPSRAARALRVPLLREIVASPDADAALRHVVELSLRFGLFDGVWAMLGENREALRLLCNLFGTSDFLARMFIAHPELLDQLLLAGRAETERGAEDLAIALGSRLQDDDLNQRLEMLRRFRNEELLRVGLHDIAGALSLQSVWQQLSDLADVILRELYPLLRGEMVRRYGEPRHRDGTTAEMALIALGKLGAQELSYASDLDLIFVYSGDGCSDGRRSIDNSEFFARLGQRLVNGLSADMNEGRLYDVDTRLRPSGNQGTLVVSLAAFVRHHQRSVDTWERQVLTRARAVAGSPALGARAETDIRRLLYGRPQEDVERLAADIAAMRRRIERELAREDGDFYDLKLGRGGLVDVEFVAQYFKLRYGYHAEALRDARTTLAVIGAARSEGLIGSRMALTLTRGYSFLRRLESRLRIVRDRSAARLPRAPQALEVMARRLGYRRRGELSAGAQVLAEYEKTTRALRGAYEEIVGR